MKKKPKLIPPDKARCQAEQRPSGYSFMTLGPIPPLVRCDDKPVCIVTELKADKKDGLKGSMSLCGRHLAVMLEHYGPNFAKVEELK